MTARECLREKKITKNCKKNIVSFNARTRFETLIDLDKLDFFGLKNKGEEIQITYILLNDLLE